LPVLAMLFVVFSGYAQKSIILSEDVPKDEVEATSNIEILTSYIIGLAGDFKINESGFANESHSLDLTNYTSKHKGSYSRPIWSNEMQSGDRVVTDGPVYMLKVHIELDEASLENGLSLYDMFNIEYKNKDFGSADLTYFLTGYDDEMLNNIIIDGSGNMSFDLSTESLNETLPITFFCVPKQNESSHSPMELDNNTNPKDLPELPKKNIYKIDLSEKVHFYKDGMFIDNDKIVKFHDEMNNGELPPAIWTDNVVEGENLTTSGPVYYVVQEVSDRDLRDENSIDLFQIFQSSDSDVDYDRTDVDYYLVQYPDDILKDVKISDMGIMTFDSRESNGKKSNKLSIAYVPKSSRLSKEDAANKRNKDFLFPTQQNNMAPSIEEGTTVKIFGDQNSFSSPSSRDDIDFYDRTIDITLIDMTKNDFDRTNKLIGIYELAEQNAVVYRHEHDIFLDQSVGRKKIRKVLFVKNGVPEPRAKKMSHLQIVYEDILSIKMTKLSHSIDVVRDDFGLIPHGKKYDVLVEVFTKSAVKYQLSHLNSGPQPHPLIVVDGERVSADVAAKLSTDKIASIEIVKGAGAMYKYGNDGNNGAVEITTREGAEVKSKEQKNDYIFPTVGVEIDDYYRKSEEFLKNYDPIFFIDGEQVTEEEFERNENREDLLFIKGYGDEEALEKYGYKHVVEIITKRGDDPLFVVDGIIIRKGELDLDPDDIKSITVIKDQAAIDKYGKNGRNGVVEIVTKNPKKTLRKLRKTSVIDTIITFDPNTYEEKVSIVAHQASKDPLVVLDGVVIGQKNVKEEMDDLVQPSDIEHMNIIKGKKALDKYGDQAVHGAVEIITKRSNKKDSQIEENYTTTLITPDINTALDQRENEISVDTLIIYDPVSTNQKIENSVLGEVLEYRFDTDNYDHTYEAPRSYQSKDISISGFINEAGNLEVSLEANGDEDIVVQMYNVLGKLIATQTIRKCFYLKQSVTSGDGMQRFLVILMMRIEVCC